MNLKPMNKFLEKQYTSLNFLAKTKLLAYLFIAFLVGLVQILEDVADGDSTPLEALGEFVLMALLLSIAFPSSGRLFSYAWQKWRNKKRYATWVYKDVVFALVCLVSFPLLLATLAVWVLPARVFEEAEDIWLLGVNLLLFIFIIIAVEFFWFVLDKKQHLEYLNERLSKNQEMAKYQALMNQLNPHFLFNSLNVLSYLVYKDQRSAEQFIEELSKIYRYIIQLNETYLVPLSKELEFVNSYMFLQKIRFQDNLTYELNIDVACYQKYLPPLTLEVLFENAIKHNIIAADQKLHIKLYSENDYLIIENNIQPRNEQEIQSNQVGLKNLSEKFQILESQAPTFMVQNNLFIAKIPLLNSEL